MIDKEIHYCNLTNGIEDLNEYPNIDFHFIRIQSTKLEQGLLEDILVDLDNDLLMNLALGNKCVIYDKASRNGETSRACWYGIPWISYCLERCWFYKKHDKVFVRNNNVQKYFDMKYNKLSNSTKRKLQYYKKFLNTTSIKLFYKCSKTTHDGDIKYYAQILQKIRFYINIFGLLIPGLTLTNFIIF